MKSIHWYILAPNIKDKTQYTKHKTNSVDVADEGDVRHEADVVRAELGGGQPVLAQRGLPGHGQGAQRLQLARRVQDVVCKYVELHIYPHRRNAFVISTSHATLPPSTCFCSPVSRIFQVVYSVSGP